MNTHYIPVLIITLLLPFLLQAQAIKSGEKIRDAKLHKVMNHTNSEASLKEFGGKPTIIHFWNTHCPVSQQALLALKNIKKEFGEALNIVTVTRDNKTKVEALLSRLPYGKELGFPFVIDDTVARKLFPHNVQPHAVWVDADGYVKAITGHEYLTNEQVKRFLQPGHFELPLKEDPVDIDLIKGGPLMNVFFPRYKDVVSQYSFIGKGMDGIGAGVSYANTRSGMMGIRVINCGIKTLYETAYKQTAFHSSRIIFKPADAERFATEPGTSKNTFCFELMMQTASKQEAYMSMQKQLDAYFGFRSRVETRNMRCLVLRRTSTKEKFSGTGNSGDTYYTDSTVVIQNIPMHLFVQNKLYSLPFFVIDETGYEGRITVELPKDYRTISSLQKALSRYDLSLTEEERELEVIALD